MSGYLLIASRDLFESVEIRDFYRLADDLDRRTFWRTIEIIQSIIPLECG
jgi:hypothetical protein